MIKPLERRALLVRLGLGLPPAGAAAAPTTEKRGPLMRGAEELSALN